MRFLISIRSNQPGQPIRRKCLYIGAYFVHAAVIQRLYLLCPREGRLVYSVVSEFEKRGNFTQNTIFLSLFNLPPFQASKSPRLQTWFASSLGLLLHRSNVRSLNKPPIPSSEQPNWGIKRRFSNAMDVLAHPAHAGSRRGS